MNLLFVLISGCAIALAAFFATKNRRLSQRLKALECNNAQLRSQRSEISRDIDMLPMRKMRVKELHDTHGCCFAVQDASGGASITLRRFYFTPGDRNDMEYKQLHAQEVADKLNEQP